MGVILVMTVLPSHSETGWPRLNFLPEVASVVSLLTNQLKVSPSLSSPWVSFVWRIRCSRSMDAERQEEVTDGIIIPARIRPFLFLFRFKRGTVWTMWDVPKSLQANVFISVVYRRRVRQKSIVLMDPSIFRDFSK
jgi:hypothetical protein